MEITSKIAKYVVDTRYEDLPETTREIVKKDFLDTLASAVAGTMDPICKNVADLVKEWGGKPESTVLVYGGRIPSLNAALINSVAAHILDLTDAHEGAATRAGVTIVPAAFAVAEANGVTNGTDLIAAAAIGLDLVCRMSLAASAGLGGSGFLLSSMTGVFGAAATTAKLLGLDQDQTVSALGIAYSQAAGNMQAYDDKAFVTRLQNGFAAKAGILSGLLAQRGVSGTRNVFSGRYGLYEIYEKGKCDLRQVTDELGERFECDNLSFKSYPSMRSTHAPIDAALDIVREHNIAAEDVNAVTIRLKKRFYDLLCVPLEDRRAPKTRVAAQTSLPYLIAVAVAKRNVTIEHFSAEALQDTTVAKIASKVIPVVDPGLEEALSQTGPVVVEIKLQDGRIYTKRVSFPKGGPENPMSVYEIAEKFRRCSDYAFTKIPSVRLARVIEMCAEMEKVADAAEIMRLLAPQ